MSTTRYTLDIPDMIIDDVIHTLRNGATEIEGQRPAYEWSESFREAWCKSRAAKVAAMRVLADQIEAYPGGGDL